MGVTRAVAWVQGGSSHADTPTIKDECSALVRYSTLWGVSYARHEINDLNTRRRFVHRKGPSNPSVKTPFRSANATTILAFRGPKAHEKASS